MLIQTQKDATRHFTRRIVHPELGDITDLFNEVITNEIYMDEIAAIRRQRAYERYARAARPNRVLGTTVARLDPGIYAHWEAIAGKGCWGDRSERESILKFAPELRCKQEKPMDRVSFAGSGAGDAEKEKEEEKEEEKGTGVETAGGEGQADE